jgi:hypothetical protein
MDLHAILKDFCLCQGPWRSWIVLNIAVKWTVYLLQTQQVKGLDINPQTNNPDHIKVILSPHSSANYAKTTSYKYLPIHSSLIFLPLYDAQPDFFLWRNSPYQT